MAKILKPLRKALGNKKQTMKTIAIAKATNSLVIPWTAKTSLWSKELANN